MKINFIEGLFSNEGHYIDDIIKYEFLKDSYELHYYINGKMNKNNKEILKNANIIVHEYDYGKNFIGQILFLDKISTNISNKDFNFVMSIKYIPFYIYINFINSFDYYLLVHFFPTVKQKIYKYVLKKLWEKSKALLVLDKPVKIELSKKIDTFEKIYVIHSRDIEKKIVQKNNEMQKNKLSVIVIGAINEYKEMDDLLELISEKQYSNIELRFCAKGIRSLLECYDNNILKKNLSVVKDKYLDIDEYKKCLEEADFVYIAYKKSYGIRFSGILFDAINNGCQIICNSYDAFRYYINKYNIGYEFSNKSELDEILSNLKKLTINDDIYIDYSSKRRKELFLDIINKEVYAREAK